MAASTISSSPRDPNTLSNYNSWLCTHTEANFRVLFDQRKLAGNVVHRLRSRTPAASKEIVLDTSNLEIGIANVTVNGDQCYQCKWELLPPQAPFGRALKIFLKGGVELDGVVDVDVCTLRSGE